MARPTKKKKSTKGSGSRKAEPKKTERIPETRVVRAPTTEAANRALEGHTLVEADVDSTGAAVLLLRVGPKRPEKYPQAMRFSTSEKANGEDFESILDAAFCLRVGGREITWVFYWQETSEDETPPQEGEAR
jgi:hypothetical protein